MLLRYSVPAHRHILLVALAALLVVALVATLLVSVVIPDADAVTRGPLVGPFRWEEAPPTVG